MSTTPPRDLPALMQWLAGMPADQALALLDDAAQAIDQQRTFMPVQAITFTEAA